MDKFTVCEYLIFTTFYYYCMWGFTGTKLDNFTQFGANPDIPVLLEQYPPFCPSTQILIWYYFSVSPDFRSKVKAANIHCENKLIKGTVHGFFSLPGNSRVARFGSKEGQIGPKFDRSGTSPIWGQSDPHWA